MLDVLTDFIGHYQHYLVWIGVISAFIFVVSLLLTPFLIGRIPENYFIKTGSYQLTFKRPIRTMMIILKSLLGLVLFIAGVIMLVTPGQGILSIVLGLFLMEFPGKYKLERRLVNHEPTFKTLNWFRKKAGKTPFIR